MFCALTAEDLWVAKDPRDKNAMDRIPLIEIVKTAANEMVEADAKSGGSTEPYYIIEVHTVRECTT